MRHGSGVKGRVCLLAKHNRVPAISCTAAVLGLRCNVPSQKSIRRFLHRGVGAGVGWGSAGWHWLEKHCGLALAEEKRNSRSVASILMVLESQLFVAHTLSVLNHRGHTVWVGSRRPVVLRDTAYALQPPAAKKPSVHYSQIFSGAAWSTKRLRPWRESKLVFCFTSLPSFKSSCLLS